jgi:hypothetical protein
MSEEKSEITPELNWVWRLQDKSNMKIKGYGTTEYLKEFEQINFMDFIEISTKFFKKMETPRIRFLIVAMHPKIYNNFRKHKIFKEYTQTGCIEGLLPTFAYKLEEISQGYYGILVNVSRICEENKVYVLKN